MDNYQATIDRMRVVRRFLIPVQSDDPLPGRPRCWGLGKEDFELVVGGHACSSCLACWAPAVLATCPCCGEEQIRERQVTERPDWAEAERERQQILAAPPVRTIVPPMHKVVDMIASEALGPWRPGVKRNL